MRSHEPGSLPRSQTSRRRFVLLVAGSVILAAAWTAADEPTPPPRIVIIRGEHRTEVTLHPNVTPQTDPQEPAISGVSALPETAQVADPLPSDPVVDLLEPGFTEPESPDIERTDVPGPFDEIASDQTTRIPLPPLSRDQPGPISQETWRAADQPVPVPERPLIEWNAGSTPANPMDTVGTTVAAAPSDAQDIPPEVAQPDATTPEEQTEHAASVAETEPEIELTAATPVVPPASRSATAMMKLDSIQAAWLGGGILLCLSFQVAIILILVRQRSRRTSANVTPGMLLRSLTGGSGESAPATERATAVADFSSDSGLLEEMDTLEDEWQSQADELKKCEAMIVEELVSMNVKMALERTQC